MELSSTTKEEGFIYFCPVIGLHVKLIHIWTQETYGIPSRNVSG